FQHTMHLALVLRVFHGDAEIFPKQDKLAGAGKKRQFGNWINICYFNADDTARFCVEGNKKINLEYFVEVAESRRVSASTLVEKSEGDHSEAPPCIQKILASGVAPGLRNEALYNICIYLKQAYPEKWRDKAFDINARVFAEPLPHGEARKTISSVAKRDYRYKCKDDPCRSFCNSSVCVERKYGITKEESNEIFIGQQPDFTTLKKYLTDPVRWGLCVNEVEIPLSTSEIMDHRRVREAVADKLTTVIPPMKNDKWLAVLKKLMDSAILIDVPDEASPAGLLWQHLIQFLQRADLDSDGTDKVDRGMLLRGMPVVQEKDGNKHVYFRGSDFVTYLRRNRAEDLKGPNLWFALKKNGVDHGSLRIGGTTRQIWSLPLHELQNYEYEDEMPEINLEF
ncbi:MAG TPA: hypothetical protein VLA13_10325, partial [Massilibacterium sp.]|nr:hypothetical protein [Massilibacterium sp.]